ncbi:sigma-54-dependent Fis family transcriptional regulator [candidate division KSB1 bacterium]|nr:sigma-54-dependent Fis family transcriptional regulator [candidate division KSB1 bacterium]
MNDKIKILLIDDDYALRTACAAFLSDAGYLVHSGKNPQEGLKLMRDTGFDIAITDYRMPGMNGIEFMRELQKSSPQTDVIMITGYGTIEHAVEAMRLGAYDYLQKPFEPGQLLETVNKLVTHRRQLGKSGDSEFRFQFEDETVSIIAKSRVMQDVFRLVEKVAPTDSTVLILGESGTGKESIARALHALSLRKNQPFLVMDCGSLVESLFESELFGHVKGSFTGAVATKHGAFELADGGTFFFDEIGNISLNIQAKILRAIQEKEIRRIGSTETIHVDVRVIAATNLDLVKAVEQGDFREDLYYRLSVIPVHLPSLRERREDIPLLLHYFVQKNNLRRQKKPIQSIDDDALSALLKYDWPGNIRELQNVVERAAIIEDTSTIRLSSLPPSLHQTTDDPRQPTLLSMVELEKQHIARTLQHTHRNISQAAKLLGIDRKTLYDKIRRYHLD